MNQFLYIFHNFFPYVGAVKLERQGTHTKNANSFACMCISENHARPLLRDKSNGVFSKTVLAALRFILCILTGKYGQKAHRLSAWS